MNGSTEHAPPVALLLFGAGGHAAVVIEVVESSGRLRVGGLTDDALERHEQMVLGHRVRPDGESNTDWPVLVAIGDNTARARIVARLAGTGRSFAPAVIHASAVVSPSAVVGEGSVVMAGAIINARARVGAHAIVNTGATIDHDCTLGDFVHVSPGAHLGGSVSVGARAHIGIGCVILPSVRVGADTIVGGGAVVIRDLADHVVAVGNPARVIRTLAENEPSATRA